MFGCDVENITENTFSTCCSHFLTFSQLPNEYHFSIQNNKTQKKKKNHQIRLEKNEDRERERRLGSTLRRDRAAEAKVSTIRPGSSEIVRRWRWRWRRRDRAGAAMAKMRSRDNGDGEDEIAWRWRWRDLAGAGWGAISLSLFSLRALSLSLDFLENFYLKVK